VWLLAFVGLRYPLQMLPLLMFEFVWKAIWLITFGLPQWSSGQLPPTFAEDFEAIAAGEAEAPRRQERDGHLSCWQPPGARTQRDNCEMP